MKIVIADDHAITRAGVIASLSEMYPGVDIVECEDAVSVLKAAKQLDLSLAVVDLFMPGSDGFGFLKKLCRLNPELPVVVLSATDNPKHIQKTLDVGVSGFIHKSSSYQQMYAAIEKVLAGGTFFPELFNAAAQPSPVEASVIDSPHNRDAVLDSLTRRQLDILACLAQGMSNKEIASALFISENTVKTHLKAILAELGCSNRTEAGVLAEKLSLQPANA